MKGSPKDVHRHRALELIALADKTDDRAVAAEMLELAAEQLDLAERGGHCSTVATSPIRERLAP
jgi:hypothetical protein